MVNSALSNPRSHVHQCPYFLLIYPLSAHVCTATASFVHHRSVGASLPELCFLYLLRPWTCLECRCSLDCPRCQSLSAIQTFKRVSICSACAFFSLDFLSTQNPSHWFSLPYKIVSLTSTQCFYPLLIYVSGWAFLCLSHLALRRYEHTAMGCVPVLLSAHYSKTPGG